MTIDVNGMIDDDWDVSLLSYEEFLQFFFGTEESPEQHHPVPLSTFEFPERVVDYLFRLFQTFPQVSERFGEPRINRGIWAIWGWNFELAKTLWDENVPLEARLGCIREMYVVYAEHVSKSTVKVMENCYDMWWDVLSDSFWMYQNLTEDKYDKLGEEGKKLIEAMFETLKKILALNDPRTQSFALHGLGHLHHPDVKKLVQQYLDEYRHEMTPEGIKWVERCRDGTVM